MVYTKKMYVWVLLLAVIVLSCQKKEVPENEIAFVSDRTGNQDIYLLDVEGDSVYALIQNEAEDWAPTWSPDGKRLAFASTRDEGWNIYVMNMKNRKIVQLTRTGKDRRPSWSPGGSLIAFTSERDGNSEIYSMNPDGTGQRNLTNHRAGDDRPMWSPDEDRLAFCSNRDGDWEVYIMTVETGALEKITDNVIPDFLGAWSRDGESIVYISGDGIVRYSFVKGTTTFMTHDDSREGNPSFSPTGEIIVFESDRSGDYDIWVMNADGTDPKNLTQHSAFDWFPQWRPSR